MREVNKDLKSHYKELESKVTQIFQYESREMYTDSDKENNVLQNSTGFEESTKRKEMLEEISMMINEYKQKQSYDNMLTNMANPMLPEDLEDDYIPA